MKQRTAAALTLLTLAVIAPAKVAPTSIGEMAALSDVTLVGRVTSVRTVKGWKFATATVESVVRGLAREKTVTFRAMPNWTCDGSWAVVGERVLLFLHRTVEKDLRNYPAAYEREQAKGLADAFRELWRSGETPYEIEWAGRGRLVLKEHGGLTEMAVERDRHRWWAASEVEFPGALASKLVKRGRLYSIGLTHLLPYVRSVPRASAQ